MAQLKIALVSAGWVLLCPMFPASAESVAVVAVDGCDAPALRDEVQALRDDLGRTAGTFVKSHDETAAPLGGLAQSSLGGLSRTLAAARADLQEAAGTARAEAALARALVDVVSIAPSPERWTEERELRTLYALVLTRQGRRADALEALGAIVAMEPQYRPDLKVYPPSLRELTETATRQQTQTTRGSLVINTVPPGAPVFVSGKPVGSAPITLELPLGRPYRVEASFSARRGVPKTVFLDSGGQEVVLEKAFEGSAFADGGPCLETQGDARARALGLARLGGLLHVETVMALRLEEEGEDRFIVGSALEVRSGQESREGRVKLRGGALPTGALPRLARFLATGEATVPVEPTRGETQPMDPLARRRQGRAWKATGWAASGLSALGAVSAVVFLQRASNFDDGWRNRILETSPNGGLTFEANTPVAAKRQSAAHQRGYAAGAAAIALASAGSAVFSFWMARRLEDSQVTVVAEPGGVSVRF